jgi:steroid 5-alpha reductase family enzyme
MAVPVLQPVLHRDLPERAAGHDHAAGVDRAAAPRPLGPLDGALAVLFVSALVGEILADQQQWEFYRRKREGEPGATADGFLHEGLFHYSRHPNYFFEMSMWWLMFGFGAVAAASLLQWSITGAVLLTVLFVGSTIMTERISASKYPRYADYQALTSPIVPWPPRVQSPRSAQSGHSVRPHPSGKRLPHEPGVPRNVADQLAVT